MTDKDRTDEVLHAIGTAKTEILREVTIQNQATRGHMANEIATVRNDGAVTKNFASRMFTGMKRLLNRMGVGTDDL